MSKALRLPELIQLRPGQTQEEFRDPAIDVEGDALAAVAAAEVRQHVRSLPDFEQQVIIGRYGLDGPRRDHRSLASELGCAVGTIWNTEQRALTMLRALALEGASARAIPARQAA